MIEYRDLINKNFYDSLYNSVSNQEIVETKVSYIYHSHDELVERTKMMIKQHLREKRLGKLLDDYEY
ncbi:MAG: hypothetical protein SLAVMIC_00891 [uncultured marine phage]|uniref:Uncharacterized protein n=1 Tax=uncultured marine phage TaxID=707152 RepID=A0A8D9CFX2_9VIRU|nr:MAG: hypothetical protein SLAVMIC_00891 [uncultured marine phage]